jgi:hypothetical protein
MRSELEPGSAIFSGKKLEYCALQLPARSVDVWPEEQRHAASAGEQRLLSPGSELVVGESPAEVERNSDRYRPRSLSIADVNEDGQQDIVASNEFGRSVSVGRRYRSIPCAASAGIGTISTR